MRRNAKSITILPFKLCSFQRRQTTDIVSERMHIDSHLFLSAITNTAYSPVSTLYSLTCKISGRIGEKSHFNKFIKIPLHKHEHDTEYRVDMNKHVDSITYSMWAAVCVCVNRAAHTVHTFMNTYGMAETKLIDLYRSHVWIGRAHIKC